MAAGVSDAPACCEARRDPVRPALMGEGYQHIKSSESLEILDPNFADQNAVTHTQLDGQLLLLPRHDKVLTNRGRGWGFFLGFYLPNLGYTLYVDQIFFSIQCFKTRLYFQVTRRPLVKCSVSIVGG
jgi:hypothetical protein